MAKTRRRKGQSISGYFRPLLIENPALLERNDNAELIEQWKRDHPNDTAKRLRKVRQNLANLKSHLRRQARENPSLATKPALRAGDGPVVLGGEVESPGLVNLENRIDDCMYLAWRIDRAGLDHVIYHLRRARNEVVAKLS
jgi:hypothetical protein